MQMQMSGRNVEVTPEMRNVTEKKLERLSRYQDSITSIHITFNIDGATHVIDGLVGVKGTSIYATAESDEMYKAMDILVEKLMRQLSKYKEKQQDHRD